MTDMMRAIEISQPGGPEVLVPCTRPVPVPGAGWGAGEKEKNRS